MGTERWDVRSNRKKPQGDKEIAEFRARHANPEITIRDIAKLYGVAERTVRQWRHDFGIIDRGVLRDLKPSAANAIRMAEATGKTLEAATKEAIQRHGERGGTIDPEAPAPLEVPEIKAAIEDFQEKARHLDTNTPLIDLQRAAMKLYALFVCMSPLHTWDGGAEMMKGLVKTLDSTRKLEAKLPPAQKDEQALRQEAATALMIELREALDPADQVVLAGLVQKGADRIQAKHDGCGDRRPLPATQNRTAL